MSVEVSSLVWRYFPRGGSDKLVILALADWCDENGGRLHPSIAALAKKVNASACQTRRILHRLIEEGWVSVVGNHQGGAPGAARRYQVNIELLSAQGRTSTSASPTTSAGARAGADARGSADARDGWRGRAETASADASQYVNRNVIETLDIRRAFAELWEAWPAGLGEKGSRKSAEAAFLKLKPTPVLCATMLRALDAQVADKITKKTGGGFAPNFPHVERWIKHHRWEDEIASSVLRSAPASQSIAEKLTDRSWADELPAGAGAHA